jgi:hypothetical protein
MKFKFYVTYRKWNRLPDNQKRRLAKEVCRLGFRGNYPVNLMMLLEFLGNFYSKTEKMNRIMWPRKMDLIDSLWVATKEKLNKLTKNN